MGRHFQNEIDRLMKKILYLAGMTEESLVVAIKAVTNNDAATIDRLREAEKRIDLFEIEVEEECLKILALHQPVAADLRQVVAVLKINNDLERIADSAVNVTKWSQGVAPELLETFPVQLDKMLSMTLKMVSNAVDSLVKHDIALAHEVLRDDDLVDEYDRATYEAVCDRVSQKPQLAREYIALLGVSRNLERIADHATNIAEDVIYMIDGAIVRHGW